MSPKPKTWISTYCNHAHSMRTGRPIRHECFRLNPAAMELERQDRFEEIGNGPGQTPMVHPSVKLPYWARS